MNKPRRPIPASNPFSTRFIRPGALPYRFPPGDSLAKLLDRLDASGGWGQIIGPHGSGKSTLIATLLPELERRGRSPFLLTFRDGQTWPVWQRIPPGTGVLIVDGFEQLGRLGRAWVRLRCRWQKRGLIVTAHQPIGLPDLYQTALTPEAAWQVVQALSSQSAQGPRIEPEAVAERLAVQAGNLREVLFELYDLIEQRRR